MAGVKARLSNGEKMPEIKIPESIKTFDKKINIVGNEYTINVASKEDMTLESGSSAYGVCIHPMRDIFVSEDLIDDDRFQEHLQETFLHEIIHAILAHTGTTDNLVTSNDEEAVIKAISNAFNVLGVGEKLVEEYLV